MAEMDKTARDVTQADVEMLPVAKVGKGPRLRESTGGVSDLKRSIEELGLMHPILVTDDPKLCEPYGTPYLLIAGERRLRACDLARMAKVPARVVPVKDVQRLIDMELEENEQRQDFSAYAISKPRYDAVQSEYQEALSRLLVPPGAPGPSKTSRATARADAQRKVGVDSKTAARDRRIVETVGRYPELESWGKRPLKLASEVLDAARPSDRRPLRKFLASFDRKDATHAAKAAQNLVERWPDDLREKCLTRAETAPEDALSAALGVPPVPDDRLVAVAKIVDDLKQVISTYRKRDPAQKELATAREHLEQAYKWLRQAYEVRRDEFSEMISE